MTYHEHRCTCNVKVRVARSGEQYDIEQRRARAGAPRARRPLGGRLAPVSHARPTFLEAQWQHLSTRCGSSSATTSRPLTSRKHELALRCPASESSAVLQPLSSVPLPLRIPRPAAPLPRPSSLVQPLVQPLPFVQQPSVMLLCVHLQPSAPETSASSMALHLG